MWKWISISAVLLLVYWLSTDAEAQLLEPPPPMFQARTLSGPDSTLIVCWRVTEPISQGIYRSYCVPQAALVLCFEDATRLDCTQQQKQQAPRYRIKPKPIERPA